MKLRLIGAVVLATAVIGCSNSTDKQKEYENQLAVVKSKLPEGCTVDYYGNIQPPGNFSVPILAVVCGKTTTLNTSQYISKMLSSQAVVKYDGSDVKINALTRRIAELEARLDAQSTEAPANGSE